MATRITDYTESITEQSRLELLGIARWLADNKKTAYLVGGWAVYYYTKPGERPSAKWGEAKWNKFNSLQLLRGGQTLGSTRFKSLRSGKSSVSHIKTGAEFGVVFSPYLDFKPGDNIIAVK